MGKRKTLGVLLNTVEFPTCRVANPTAKHAEIRRHFLRKMGQVYSRICHIYACFGAEMGMGLRPLEWDWKMDREHFLNDYFARCSCNLPLRYELLLFVSWSEFSGAMEQILQMWSCTILTSRIKYLRIRTSKSTI